MSANVEKCTVVVCCSEDKVNPVNFKWMWGEAELPIVDPYTYLSVEIPKDCSWDAHIHSENNNIEKGKSQVSRQDGCDINRRAP